MRRVGWNTLARPALTFWQWRFIPVFRCCWVYKYSCPAAHKPMGPFCGELTGPPVNGSFKKRARLHPSLAASTISRFGFWSRRSTKLGSEYWKTVIASSGTATLRPLGNHSLCVSSRSATWGARSKPPARRRADLSCSNQSREHRPLRAATMRFPACVPPLDRAVVSKIALLLLDRIPKCRT